MGWMSFSVARWVWAVANVALLAWLAAVAVRASRTREPLERAFVFAFFFTSSAPLVTFGLGQLTMVVVAALLASVLVSRAGPSLAAAALSAGAMLVALVKPNIAAPFFWLLLVGAPSLVPAALVVAGYAGLSWFAARFQPGGLVTQLERWVATSTYQAGQFTYSDLPEWLRAAGAASWSLPASLALLVFIGVWVWRHRRVDLWLQIGMVAILGRIWTTHRIYDDLLVFLAMIALLRVLRGDREPSPVRTAAALLLAGNWLMLLAPVSIVSWAPPASTFFDLIQAVLWISTAIVLGRYSARAAPESPA